MGQGFVVLEAARAAASGADLDEVVARAEEVARRVHVLAALDTLEYLHRGGRIGGAAAFLGSMLQIKPIVYVADGIVAALAKPRTMSRAVQLMLKEIARRTGSRPLHVAVLHADVLDAAEELRQQIHDRFECIELHITEFTPVMGAHAGSGVLGVAFHAE
jgi:DegV family protein with EDD domain